MNSPGFTLLELLVVLALAALALAVVVPNLPSALQGAELTAAQRQVAAGLKRTRLRAIEGNREALFDGGGLPLSGGLSLHLQPEEGVRFFPDGSSTGGRVAVADGERMLAVDIDWLTGRVSLAR